MDGMQGGCTALMCASAQGRAEVVRLLLSSKFIETNVQDTVTTDVSFQPCNYTNRNGEEWNDGSHVGQQGQSQVNGDSSPRG